MGVLIFLFIIAVAWSGLIFRVVLVVFGKGSGLIVLFLRNRGWGGEVVMTSGSSSLFNDFLQVVTLFAHHDAQDDDHNNLEDSSSLKGFHPEWVLGDVCLDGPKTLLSHMEDSHANEERHDTPGFQDVIHGKLSLRNWFVSGVVRWT